MTESTTTLREVVTERHAPQYYPTVLRYFRTNSTAVATVDDLATHISDRRNDDQRRVAIRLHHVTLPKLADAGVIDYDARRNTARYRGDELDGPLTEETDG